MGATPHFIFARPEWFHLFWIVGLVVAGAVLSARWRKRALARFADSRNVNSLIATCDGRSRFIKRALFLSGLSFLVLSASGPMWGKKAVIVETRGKDVMFIVDVSASMLAEDLRPNRLERAKLDLSRLIDRLAGNRLGLIIFSGDSYVLCPLTLDAGACALLVEIIQAGSMPRPGTALSGAIEKAIESFETGETEHRAVILITDGEDLEGGIDRAIERARERGVRIYPVGYATEEGAPISIRGEDGSLRGYKKNRDGETVVTSLNRSLLDHVADETGGEFFHAASGGSLVDEVAREIEGLEEKILSEEEIRSYRERFQWPLSVALFLLVVEAVLGERRKRGGIS